MFEVSVSGWFAAAHRLHLADGTPEAPHRHEWRVTATLAGPKLNQTGVLLDFARFKGWLDELLATLHERDLNELPAFARRAPSAENLAAHLAGQLAAGLPDSVRLRCVEVEEAPGCIARYWPVPGQKPSGQPRPGRAR